MTGRHRGVKASAWAGLLLALPAATLEAAPPAGRYEGRLCVASRGAEPECGPARVDLRSARRADVRISDILYTLTLHSSQVDVVLKHGAMQIDGFTAPYEWIGAGKDAALQFVDAAKGVRYEVRFGERARPAANPAPR
jgi:hypothetical protein